MEKEKPGKRLKRLREETRYENRPMSRYRLALLSKVSRPHISRIEAGIYGLNYETAAKLAPHLNTTPEYLMGISEKEDVAEKIAKRLGNVIKEAVSNYEAREVVAVNVEGYVPGGYPMPREQQPLKPILVPVADMPKPRGPQPIFALMVRGESMIGDDILNGSHVLIDPNDKELVNGKVYLVNTEDGATIKHITLKDGRQILKASNGNFHDMTPDSIEIVGRVRGVYTYKEL